MTEVRYFGLNLSWMIPAATKHGNGPVGSLSDLNGHLLCDINLSPSMRSCLKFPDSDRRWLDFRQPF